MLICSVCGKINPPTSRNCDVCGAPLAAADVAPGPHAATMADSTSGPICPICKRGNRPGSAFCSHCGYRLVQPTGAQAYALPYAAAAAPIAPPRHNDIPAEISGNIPAGTILKRRYRIMRKVAQGGMGAVYECSDILAPSGA